jgi:hypothetical protein
MAMSPDEDDAEDVRGDGGKNTPLPTDRKSSAKKQRKKDDRVRVNINLHLRRKVAARHGKIARGIAEIVELHFAGLEAQRRRFLGSVLAGHEADVSRLVERCALALQALDQLCTKLPRDRGIRETYQQLKVNGWAHDTKLELRALVTELVVTKAAIAALCATPLPDPEPS